MHCLLLFNIHIFIFAKRNRFILFLHYTITIFWSIEVCKIPYKILSIIWESGIRKKWNGNEYIISVILILFPDFGMHVPIFDFFIFITDDKRFISSPYHHSSWFLMCKNFFITFKILCHSWSLVSNTYHKEDSQM